MAKATRAKKKPATKASKKTSTAMTLRRDLVPFRVTVLNLCENLPKTEAI